MDADLLEYPDDAEEQEDEVKPVDLDGVPLRTALRRLVELSADYDQKRIAFEQAKRDKKAHELAIWLRMEEEGDTSLTKDLGPPFGKYQFVPNETIRGYVLDDEKFQEWLEDRALVDEVSKPEYRKRRLNEFAKEALEAGGELPPGMDFSRTQYITKTRKVAKPKRKVD